MPVVIQNPLDVLIELDIKKALSPEKLFDLAEALDAYEVKESVEESVVVDITEVSKEGKIVVHIIPKKMLSYKQIFSHVDALMKTALKNAKFRKRTYSVKKIFFRTIAPGTPSSIVSDVEKLKGLVDELWQKEFGDASKSYV